MPASPLARAYTPIRALTAKLGGRSECAKAAAARWRVTFCTDVARSAAAAAAAATAQSGDAPIPVDLEADTDMDIDAEGAPGDDGDIL